MVDWLFKWAMKRGICALELGGAPCELLGILDEDARGVDYPRTGIGLKIV